MATDSDYVDINRRRVSLLARDPIAPSGAVRITQLRLSLELHAVLRDRRDGETTRNLALLPPLRGRPVDAGEVKRRFRISGPLKS